MVRGALSIYLIVASLAGPQACCCASVPPASQRGQHRATTAPAPARHSCCQRRHASKPANLTATERQQPPQHHDSGNGPRCPCREQAPLLASALPAVLETDIRPTVSDQPAATHAAAQADFALRAPLDLSVHRGHGPPFLSPQDLRDHCHILRC
jgi:hypothetical protein